jgi:ABC-type dipeptide/oligopeptide/nickel transport system ATPase component
MNQGRNVEIAGVFHDSREEYTRALLAARLRPDLHVRAPVRL